MLEGLVLAEFYFFFFVSLLCFSSVYFFVRLLALFFVKFQRLLKTNTIHLVEAVLLPIGYISEEDLQHKIIV